jgi:hypothetical protein
MVRTIIPTQYSRECPARDDQQNHVREQVDHRSPFASVAGADRTFENDRICKDPRIRQPIEVYGSVPAPLVVAARENVLR